MFECETTSHIPHHAHYLTPREFDVYQAQLLKWLTTLTLHCTYQQEGVEAGVLEQRVHPPRVRLVRQSPQHVIGRVLQLPVGQTHRQTDRQADRQAGR